MQTMAIAPDSSALQVFYGTIPLIGAILLANWNNNLRLKELSNRMDDLKVALNNRIDDLNTATTSGFKDVKDQIGRLENRIADLEKGSRLVRS